jgi:hypothetical protein
MLPSGLLFLRWDGRQEMNRPLFDPEHLPIGGARQTVAPTLAQPGAPGPNARSGAIVLTGYGNIAAVVRATCRRVACKPK